MAVSRLSRSLTGASLVAATAVGVWLIGPRFSIGGPSLVDDWAAIHFSPHQVSNLGRLLSIADGRFRPGWTVWNYLQWHTLGAPGDMVGPNAWAVLRIIVFVGGVGLFAYLLCRPWATATRGSVLTTVLLAAIAPLLVISTPNVAIDFARFGPQEPLLVGFLTLGASLLFLGTRELVRDVERRRLGRAAVLLSAGVALWVAGVYQKEVSVCVVALAPFFYLAKRVEIRRALSNLDRQTRLLLVCVSAAILAPLAHVAVEVALVTHRGKLIYKTHVTVGSGAVHDTIKFFTKMPSATGSRVGLVIFAALSIWVAVSVLRRKPDWLVSGLLLTAGVFLASSAQTGLAASRFYIPSLSLLAVGVSLVLARLAHRSDWIVLLVVAATVGVTVTQLRYWSSHPGIALSHPAIALAALVSAGIGLLLARTGRPAVAVAVAAVCVLVVGSAAMAHRAVASWAADDKRGDAMVHAIARARLSACPVVETGVDPERTLSIPVLSALVIGHQEQQPSCVGQAFLVEGPHPSQRLIAACPRPGRKEIGDWELQGEVIQLVRCDGLTPSEARLLRARRL